MITAYEAYYKVAFAHPDKYVHIMYEHEAYYSFAMLNNDEVFTNHTFVFWWNVVDKHTGEMKDVPMHELDWDDCKRINISMFDELS